MAHPYSAGAGQIGCPRPGTRITTEHWMSPGAGPVFRSSARRGFSTEVSSYPGRVLARKLAGEVDVQFASQPCAIQTREGTVQAHLGDAIIRGVAGERWRDRKSVV